MAPSNSGSSKQSKIRSFFKASDGSNLKKSAPKQQTTLSFPTDPNATSVNEDAEEGSDDMKEINNDEKSEKLDTQESPGSERDTKKKRGLPRKSTKATAKETASDVKENEDDDVDDEPVAKKRRRKPKVVDDEEEDVVMEDAKDDIKAPEGDYIKAASRKTTAAKTEKEKNSESPKSGKQARSLSSPKIKRAKSSSSSKTKKKETFALAPAPAAIEDDEKETAKAVVVDASEESDESVDSASEGEEPATKAAKTKVQKKLVKEIDSKDLYPDWKAGDPAPYGALVTTFSVIELTTKRLEITAHCAKLLRQIMRLTPDDLLSTILLMINKLAPDYAGIELGIGESLIMKAIGEVTGRSLQVIKQDQKEVGDLGLVAVKSKSTQQTMYKPKPLTIQAVHKSLLEIATLAGNGAQQRKVDGIKKLLAAADVKSPGRIDINKNKGGPSEAKFIVRFLEGKLRLGLAEKTVLSSLAHAIVFHEAASNGKEPTPVELQQGEGILKTVFSELPSYDAIIPAILENGLSKLRETCKLRPGVPLKPMLANPTKAITEVLDRFENQTFTCEYKYDGERAQIHYVAKDQVMDAPGVGSLLQPHGNGVSCIFSRNSEDLSKKYPDVLARLHAWIREDTTSFVLDCETVAWDVAEKKVLPFQQLMTRKRKDVKIEDVKVKVCVFAFDLLYLNGEAVVEKPLRERRELLHKAFAPAEGEFAFATHMNSQEIDDIQTFLDESVKASCEGLMVKMLDGTESGYEPSKRSRNWLKIKKDYLSGVGDSLDLVVIGAYYGKGKRTSVYGAFLLACWNPKSEKYETICNIGTGFSEQVLETLHADLSQHVIDRPKPFYAHSAGGQHQPDVWFEPRQVWEVRTADLTLSPRYKAGHGEGIDTSDEPRGISLRFPRFIKVRDDKKPDEATSSRQVAEMYRKQESVSKTKGVDDDFEY